MNRRKIRRYRSHRGNSGVKFLGFVGIMIVAVICGYLTARFIIAPLLGYDTEVLKLDFPSKLTDVFHSDDSPESENDDGTENNADSSEEGGAQSAKGDDQDAETEKGYALQFGLFSSRDRAEELADKLRQEGIDVQIKKKEDQYKVISPLVDTKEEALETLKNTESEYVDDIFVTRF